MNLLNYGRAERLRKASLASQPAQTRFLAKCYYIAPELAERSNDTPANMDVHESYSSGFIVIYIHMKLTQRERDIAHVPKFV